MSTGQFDVSASDQQVVAVTGGTATFNTGTNVPGVTVHGKSASVTGRAEIRLADEGLVLEQLDARLPVDSLKTGLGLRDEHMRKYIFTDADGSRPDVRFFAERTTCRGAKNAASCVVEGQLAVRGASRPWTITLKVVYDDSAYRVVGEGVVKLSTYGIAAPSQLGVRTQDDVKLRIDLTAHTRPMALALRGNE